MPDWSPFWNLSVSQYKPTFWLLGGAVGCVLLIACANVANLLFGRSASRLSEISVRLAIGASRARVFRQLLAESLLLATLGAAAGALSSVCMNGLIRALGPSNVPRFQQVSFDLNSFWFVILCAVVTALLFGTLPAWKTARDTLPSDLKGRGFHDVRATDSSRAGNRTNRHRRNAARFRRPIDTNVSEAAR